MIQGDITVLLNSLGAREGDPRLQAALDFVGGEVEVDVFDEEDGEARYLVMVDRGVDFLLRDGEVSTVFVYAAENPEQTVYEESATLVEGVDFDVTPDALVATLGEPLRATPRYVIYAADPGFVQFDFDGDRLTLVSAMARDIGGAPTA